MEEKVELCAKIVQITVVLTKDQGDLIKELIEENYVFGFPRYCQMVGIRTPNFYSVLKGERQCSLEFLNKLLSGIEYEAIIISPEVQIRERATGEIVVDVDYILQENELSLDEKEETDTTDSYSSERLLDH